MKLTERDLDKQIADKRAPLPRMFDVELDTPWFIPAAVVVFFGALLVSHLVVRHTL